MAEKAQLQSELTEREKRVSQMQEEIAALKKTESENTLKLEQVWSKMREENDGLCAALRAE